MGLTFDNHWDAIGLLVLMTAALLIAGWLIRAAARTRVMLERRLVELATLNRVGQAITANLSLDALLEAIYEQVRTLCDVSTFYIALVASDSNRITFPYAVRHDQTLNWPGRDVGNGLAEHVIRTRHPLLLDGHIVSHLEALRLEPDDALMPACYLGIPLVVRDEVIGVMALQHGENAYAYSQEDSDLLMTVAAQAAVALRNARLFEETQAATTELHTLVETSRMFTASLDLDHVAQTVVARLVEATSVRAASLYQWHSNHNALHVLAHNPPSTKNLPVSLLEDQQGTLRQVVLDQQQSLITYTAQPVLLIPVTVQDQPVGLLALWSDAAPVFSEGENRLVEGIILQAATALQNAITYSLTDASLRDRVIELSTIEVVSRHMSATLDLETIISDVLAAVMSAIDASIGNCVLEVNLGVFALVSRLDTSGARLDLPVIQDLHQGIIGRVLRTQQPALINNTADDPDYISLTPETRSELCVPIVFEGHTIGAVDFEETRLSAFTDSHVRFVSTLAEHLAIAIENARLFNDRRRQIDTLLSLRTLSLQLLMTLDWQPVIEAVVERVQTITHAQSVHLYLRPDADSELACVAQHGSDAHHDAAIHRQQVARTGKPYYSSEVHTLLVYSTFVPDGFDALACIPLQRSGQVLGVLEVVFKDPHYYTQNELQALEVLANQTAVALENIRLYEAVRAGRDQLQAILDSTREAMVLFDGYGRLLRANPAAEHMLGQPLAPYVGQSFLRWLHKAGKQELQARAGHSLAQLRLYVLDVLDQPARVTHRKFRQVVGDDIRYIDETGLPVLDHQSQPVGWLLVWRDVTEDRQLEALRQELSSMIVHDLRNPITSIISSLTMMQDFLDDQQLDVELFHDVIHIARNSAENMLNLVQSLLDIARLEQSTVLLDCESRVLSDAVDYACASVFSLATSAHINLTVHIPPDLPPVWIDDEKIQRVLINLLDNALRHTPLEGKIRIEAAPNYPQREVLVRVVDTGPGIPAEARARIFEKFAQLDRESLRGHKGTGLGLTFCKLAIEAHGGRIWVEDGPEGGAAFCFTLPATPTESNLSRLPLS